MDQSSVFAGFRPAPWKLVASGCTWRAMGISFGLALAALPMMLCSLVLLPWLPLVGRAVAALGRACAGVMGIDIAPRPTRGMINGPQLIHLVIQILLAAVSVIMWFAAVLFIPLLFAMPFIFVSSIDSQFDVGFWSTDNPVLVAAACWPLGIVLFIVLLYGSWAITGLSVKATSVLLSPNQQEVDSLLASRATVIDAFDGERQRIERELHDGPQQYLTALQLNLSTLELALESDRDPEKALRSARHNAAEALASLRATVRGISPQVLYDEGLQAAIDELLVHSGLDTTRSFSGRERGLDATSALLAYHCVAEALTNATKHGKAQRVAVRVEWMADSVRVSIADDGQGPPATPSTSGTGLVGLRERAADLHGTLTLLPDVRLGGARLELTVPYRNLQERKDD
ncbi:sensor histidine kinase [Corynebacterium sp. 32222D000AT]|nr:sensor histidine kinase [Mycobacteriaceae bacterium]MDY5829194.1 sensor histidine kinase [Corynebacterium sp.]